MDSGRESIVHNSQKSSKFDISMIRTRMRNGSQHKQQETAKRRKQKS